MLEAKDQGHKAQVLSKKKKKRSSQKFFRRFPKKKRSSQKFFKRSPLKNVFQTIFQALHKILTFQKIVLSSSRGQANFRGLEAKAKDFKLCPRGQGRPRGPLTFSNFSVVANLRSVVFTETVDNKIESRSIS